MTPFDISHPLNAFDIKDNEDVWVFAYGSLMWNPDFDYEEKTIAHICGYHRRFCLKCHDYRGHEEQHGLVLGLDRGGSCRGMGFKINPASLTSALEKLWRREMNVPDAYIAKRVPIVLGGDINNRVLACVFISNPDHLYYVSSKCRDQAADIIAKAHGCRGSNLEYLERTITQLRSLEIHDAQLEEIYTKAKPESGDETVPII